VPIMKICGCNKHGKKIEIEILVTERKPFINRKYCGSLLVNTQKMKKTENLLCIPGIAHNKQTYLYRT
jgi:hypothetical protein